MRGRHFYIILIGDGLQFMTLLLLIDYQEINYVRDELKSWFLNHSTPCSMFPLKARNANT